MYIYIIYIHICPSFTPPTLKTCCMKKLAGRVMEKGERCGERATCVRNLEIRSGEEM